MNSKTPTVNSIGALSASSWRHGGLVLVCVAQLACAGKSAGASADATPGGDTAGSLADDAGASGSDSGAVGDTAGSDPVDVAGGDSADDDVVLAKDLPCVDLAKVKPGTPCDDGDPCTSVDQCHGGKCRGVVDTCMDGDVCTEDKCDKGTCTFVVVNDSLGCGKADVPNPVPEVGEWPAEAVPARQAPPHHLTLKDGSLLLVLPCHVVRASPTWKWTWTFDLPKFVGRPGQGTRDPKYGDVTCDTSKDHSETEYDQTWIADAAETPNGGFLLLGHGEGSTKKYQGWNAKDCGTDCLLTWVLPLSASGQPIGDRRALRRAERTMHWWQAPWPTHGGAIARVDRDRYVAAYPRGYNESNIGLTILRASGEVIVTRTLSLPAGDLEETAIPTTVMWGRPGKEGSVSWSLQPNGLLVRTGVDGGVLNVFHPGPFPAMSFAMSDGRLVLRRPLETTDLSQPLAGTSAGLQRQLTVAADWSTMTHAVVFGPYQWLPEYLDQIFPYQWRVLRTVHDPVRKMDFTPTLEKVVKGYPYIYSPEPTETRGDWLEMGHTIFLRSDRSILSTYYAPVTVKATCHDFLDPDYPPCKQKPGACEIRAISNQFCSECFMFPLSSVPCGDNQMGICEKGECKSPPSGTP